MVGSRYLFVVCLLFHSAALAQATPQQRGAVEDATKKQASAHFRRGAELYQEDAFRAALIEFQRAQDLRPDYRLLYNIAQTKLALQDYLGAAQSYEAYLAQGESAISGERRAQVEAVLASLGERVGRLGITVNVAGAEVFVDEVRVGTTPIPSTIRANVGRHRVLARSADGANDARTVDLAGGDVVEVSLVLAPPRLAPTATEEREVEHRPWSRKRKLAVTSWAAGGLMLAGSVAAAVLAVKSDDELASLLETRDVDQSEVAETRSALKLRAITADVLIGTGAAAVVTGTLLWLLDRRADKVPALNEHGPVELSWDVGFGSMRLEGRF